MKKMKFTLGLVLSMLILGASVGYAQSSNSMWPHNGSITVTAKAAACDFYAQTASKAVIYPTIKRVVVYPDNSPYKGKGYEPVGTTYTLSDPKNATTCQSIQYGSNAYNVQNMTFNETTRLFEPATTTTSGNIKFWEQTGASVYNRIEINLAYFYGNELQPIVKRVMTFGRWVRQASGSDERNNLEKLDSPILPDQYIIADSAWIRPHMDLQTGIATYIYEDQIFPLLYEQHYVLFQIDYIITINDEFDSPRSNVDYQKPAGTDVTLLRGVEIVAEDGITTDPNWRSGVHYVPTLKDFVFTAQGACEIDVTTTPNRDRDFLDGGITKKLIGEDTWEITIKKVQRNLVVNISSASTNSGDATGNKLIASDAVWAANGMLTVKAAKPGTLSIYSVTGQLFKQVTVSGTSSWALPKGLYVVQLNGKAYKVVN